MRVYLIEPEPEASGGVEERYISAVSLVAPSWPAAEGFNILGYLDVVGASLGPASVLAAVYEDWRDRFAP